MGRANHSLLVNHHGNYDIYFLRKLKYVRFELSDHFIESDGIFIESNRSLIELSD